MNLQKKKRVLLSNLPLPYDRIGSWTFEFNFLLQQAPLFDYVLSPNPVETDVFRFCRKRKWFKGAGLIKNLALLNWVFRDYIKELKRISKEGLPLQLLVVDDQAMLTAISLIKPQLPKGTELLYYHHGHSIMLSPEVMNRIDKVFFLTRSGYRESVSMNMQFTPEVEIMGNGISSELFFPLSKEVKLEKRKLAGFDSGDILVTWMANSRPVKGIHLFEKLIPSLLSLDSRVKILIIGNSVHLDLDSKRVIQKGRMSPSQVAEILQISDFYFFTSLWKEGFGLSLAEAIKCGNFIFCSKNGGIGDVVEGYPRVRLIEDPNILSSWIDEFEALLSSDSWRALDDLTRKSLFDFHSLESWEKRIRQGLQ